MHPFLQQNELLDFCRRKHIVVTAYSPLGSPGRDTKPADEPILMQEEAVRVAADAVSSSLPPGGQKKQGAVTTVGQTLLLWAWHRGQVAIPKSVTKSRIQENYWSSLPRPRVCLSEIYG